MSALTGWPFWAPSDMEAVERALDLAGVGEGDHVVDLGCGDGQVLVAAARRGASVAGVESDIDLVEAARSALEQNDLKGDVVHGDVFEYPLDADVLFTYLAPATLQRLVPRLQSAAPGTRLVTVDFEVPGLEPAAVDGRNHLYRLPARVLPPQPVGWAAPAILVAAPPESHSLTCLLLHHAGGRVKVAGKHGLGDVVTVQTGADEAGKGEPVAVDLRWDELEEGTFVTGVLRVRGRRVPDLPVYALVTTEEHGLWEVNDDGAKRLARRVEYDWEPSTFDELLAACDADADADE
ncbi:MAG TPA: class I SAM-dependent methyltransferase [Acidimicrobiales bacterium]